MVFEIYLKCSSKCYRFWTSPNDSLHDVARFVAEKLSTLQGVISTATHFHLKTYKRDGFLATADGGGERLAVAP